MLTTSQRERILHHLQRGWKLPDSLVHELWEAYEALEQAQTGSARLTITRTASSGQSAMSANHVEARRDPQR